MLVTGDSDFTPLVRRFREFGKWVVGVGADSSASGRLVSVSSEYKYWDALVTEADPAACSVVSLAFDSTAAQKLLIRVFEEVASDTPTASEIKGRRLALDPSFDEHDYGCVIFRDFLARFPRHVMQTGRSGNDITLTLISRQVSGTN